ncbi:MAG: hypothetical protein GTO23_03105 [Nitrososphaeria archaeon]|nr:hypothetical protein [Nitrososphaeria archaeon]
MTKTANVTTASVGDWVKYTITVQHNATLPPLWLERRLPTRLRCNMIHLQIILTY